MLTKNDFKQNSGGTFFRVKVIPNSAQFEVLGFDSWSKKLRIKVTAPALEGLANQELVRELGKLLQTKVEIVKGTKANDKMLLVRDPNGKLSSLLSH